MAWYAYGYFVWTPNGVVHSGHDFGPTLDTYKVGDSLGVRSGVEGIGPTDGNASVEARISVRRQWQCRIFFRLPTARGYDEC